MTSSLQGSVCVVRLTRPGYAWVVHCPADDSVTAPQRDVFLHVTTHCVNPVHAALQSYLHHCINSIHTQMYVGSGAASDPYCQSTWLSVCLSTTLTLNISEIKRFRGSCLIGTLQVSATACRLVTSLTTSRVYDDVILVTSQSSNPSSRSETKIQINYPCEPFDHTVSWNVVFHSA